MTPKLPHGVEAVVILRWRIGASEPEVVIPEGAQWSAHTGQVVSPAPRDGAQIPDSFFGDPGRNFHPSGIRVRAGKIYVSDKRKRRILFWHGATFSDHAAYDEDVVPTAVSGVSLAATPGAKSVGGVIRSLPMTAGRSTHRKKLVTAEGWFSRPRGALLAHGICETDDP